MPWVVIKLSQLQNSLLLFYSLHKVHFVLLDWSVATVWKYSSWLSTYLIKYFWYWELQTAVFVDSETFWAKRYVSFIYFFFSLFILCFHFSSLFITLLKPQHSEISQENLFLWNFQPYFQTRKEVQINLGPFQKSIWDSGCLFEAIWTPDLLRFPHHQ